jgi:hypothetical protein
MKSLGQVQTAEAGSRIISRAEWGADESLMNWDPQYQEPRKQIIHHTATSNYDMDPAATIRSIYYYHAVSLGWGDIGYNYLIDQYGNIYEGRCGGNGVIGGHALSWNYGSIGIAVLGDYSGTGVSAQTYNALVDLMTWNSNVNRINPLGNDWLNGTYSPNYLGHRDVYSTNCPGDYLYMRIPSIRNAAYVRYVVPRGTMDYAYIDGPGRLSVGGWAIDSNVIEPIDVHVYLDGLPVAALTADGDRPDVGAVYPGFGPDHGYALTLPDVTSGQHSVCAYGINVGDGGNALLGCGAVEVPASDPFGSFDDAAGANNGKIGVSGWIIDTDAGTGSTDVHFYVNGVFKGIITADGSRPDVGTAFPGYGSAHGFSGQVDAEATVNTVCAYGINQGPGGNALLGCRTVNVQVNPFGSFDGASAAVDVYGLSTGKLDVGGWAIDPNAGTGSIDVHFYVNGLFRGALTADNSRADLAAIFPYGPNHGFSGQVDVAAYNAVNTICAYGINEPGSPGGNALLGCRTVPVPPQSQSP